jgi:uncharacterized protein
MQKLVADRRKEIAELCRRFGVRRLELFGSAVRDDFDPARSDLDFVVEYQPGARLGALEAYFGLKEGLEGLLGRPVDLLEPGAVRNPYMKAEIESSRETVFAA